MLGQDRVATTPEKRRSDEPKPLRKEEPAQRQSHPLGSYLPKLCVDVRQRPSTEYVLETGSSPGSTSEDQDLFATPREAGHSHPALEDAAFARDNVRSSATSGRSPSMASDLTSLNPRASIMTDASIVSNIDRSDTRHERAQFLYDKFGLNMTKVPAPKRQVSPDTETAESLQRMQKRTRLRMHAFCHGCQTPFGVGTICTKCQHRRCRLCPRAAPKGVRNLVERTRKTLEDLQQAKPKLDIESLTVNDRLHDGDNKSPAISVAADKQSDKSSKRSSLRKLGKSSATATPEPKSPGKSRTMESILSARDPSIPRPLSLRMHIDGPGSISYQSAFARGLCSTLEEAVVKMCHRHDWNHVKVIELFPMSFSTLATLSKARARQPRTFRLPRIKIRTPCPGCGQPLPGRAGSCRMCMNVGYGRGEQGSLRRAMTAY